MTITEQLDKHYREGLMAVVMTHYRAFPISSRDDIRATKDGRGIEFRQGKKWTYAFPYQVKFARMES